MTEGIRIAFLAIEKTTSKMGLIGGLLVIDSNGLPLEFMCTHSVRPSEIQRQLYGDTLEPHISVHLCGKRLLAKLENAASVVVVKETPMLELRQFVECPVISLRTPDTPDVSSRNVNRYKLETKRGDFPVIETGCNSKYQEDWATAEPLLQEAAKSVDLLEPFERIKTALEALGKREERFS